MRILPNHHHPHSLDDRQLSSYSFSCHAHRLFFAPHPRALSSSNMRSAALRPISAAASSSRLNAARSISTTASRAFATPTPEGQGANKQANMKEMKIYRWVSRGFYTVRRRPLAAGVVECFGREANADEEVWLTRCFQNPDAPAEKPKLQSYKIDLGQCGPMVLDALVSSFRAAHKS